MLRRGSVYTIGTVFQLLGSILLLPLTTRVLAPSAYGIVAVAIVIQTLLATLGGAGLPETATRTFFAFEDGPARARSAVLIALVFSTAAALVSEALGPLWSHAVFGSGNETIRHLAVWSSIPLAVALTAQSVLRAMDRAIVFSAIAAGSTVGAQLLGVCAATVSGNGAAAYLAGYLSGLIIAAIAAIASVGLTAAEFRPLRSIGGTLRTSLPSVGFGLGLYVLWAGDRALVKRIEGAEAAGRYQVAYIVGALAITGISAIYNAWAPAVYRMDEQRRWLTLADTAATFQRLSGLFAVICALLAPLILRILVPASYQPVKLAHVATLVALATFPFVSFLSALQVVLWRGRTKWMAVSALAAAATNVALNLLLIPMLGLNGAALATVGSYAVLAAFLGYRARHLEAVPWKRASGLWSLALTVSVLGGAFIAPEVGVTWLAARSALAAGLGLWALRSLRTELRAERIPVEARHGEAAA